MSNNRYQPNKPHPNKNRNKGSNSNNHRHAGGWEPILPYGFATINPEHRVEASPVWHDGSNTTDALFSGEIRCTLQALTPLLVGNTHYEYSKANSEIRDAWSELDKSLDKKTIIEPLRLNDGRVVIPGTSIKGMLRHSLSALLHAPMERVAEHHYSYRPNTAHADRSRIQREVRPAIIEQWTTERRTVLLLPDPRCAVFIRSDAWNKVQPSIKTHNATQWLRGTFDSLKIEKYPLLTNPEGQTQLNHRVCNYAGGIDGNGVLARNKTYEHALIAKNDLEKSKTIAIPESVYNAYLKTQEILQNKTIGHLSNRHPLSANFKPADVAGAIANSTTLSPGQLVYVEVELQNNQPPSVTSMGHHYQYRWAYTSSVRYKNGQEREELSATNAEKTLIDDAPHQLSGARLLFGYTHSEQVPIGKGSFERLAGRIAINHAVSNGIPEFLSEEKQYCIPLAILGQPKASSWEFYLNQNEQAPLTWGDLPGDAGGDLAGRKFYRHQPKVKEVDKLTDNSALKTELAPLARFVSKAGTKFKFAIRFRQLRKWELGVLLATLQPKLLAGQAEDNQGKQRAVQYAHKLGLGRPLGMGSVVVNTDAILVNEAKTPTLRDNTSKAADFIADLREKLNTEAIKNWLALHQYDPNDPNEYDYPRGDKHEIHSWHTKLHQDYAKSRREFSNSKENIGLMKKIKERNPPAGS